VKGTDKSIKKGNVNKFKKKHKKLISFYEKLHNSKHILEKDKKLLYDKVSNLHKKIKRNEKRVKE